MNMHEMTWLDIIVASRMYPDVPLRQLTTSEIARINIVTFGVVVTLILVGIVIIIYCERR